MQWCCEDAARKLEAGGKLRHCIDAARAKHAHATRSRCSDIPKLATRSLDRRQQVTHLANASASTGLHMHVHGYIEKQWESVPRAP